MDRKVEQNQVFTGKVFKESDLYYVSGVRKGIGRVSRFVLLSGGMAVRCQVDRETGYRYFSPDVSSEVMDRLKRVEMIDHEVTKAVLFEAWLRQNRDIYEGMSPIQRLEMYLRRPKVGGVEYKLVKFEDLIAILED